jgi:immune inhibitor A
MSTQRYRSSCEAKMAFQRTDTRSCAVSPHPDALARLQAQFIRDQQAAGSTEFSVPSQLRAHFSQQFGQIALPTNQPRLVLPPNPPELTPDEKRIRNLIFQRTPLRGAIKYVRQFSRLRHGLLWRECSLISHRMAVVLVEFPGTPVAANAKQRITDLFFSRNTIATGSVAEYYAEASSNIISLSGQVVGPYTLTQAITHYANGTSGRGPRPNVQDMAAEALPLANRDINFSSFDMDRNGLVDAYIIVHAGTGAEYTLNGNDIWSQRASLPTMTAVDGVNVFNFLTIPEDAHIGVCAHELGHLLFEWPDLYDIDSNADRANIGIVSQGIGNWCLMAGGNWNHLPGQDAGTTPCHPSAWCKQHQGWVTTVRETINRPLSLGDVKSTRELHRLWSYADAASSEYFLIENRQQTGFDRGLPGSGLLGKVNIYIDYSASCLHLLQSGISTTSRKTTGMRTTTGSD